MIPEVEEGWAKTEFYTDSENAGEGDIVANHHKSLEPAVTDHLGPPVEE